MVSVSELVDRARGITASRPRSILGIVGPPGAGKSTLCAALLEELRDQAVLVPMDGFHLANLELDRLGRRARKGAPDTFDVDGYLALLRRLRQPHTRPVYAPVFDRDLEESIGSAVAVLPDTPLVITEGNYLLFDGAWAEVRELLDEVWFLDVDPKARKRRLILRRRSFGHSAPDAESWVHQVDEPNIAHVEPTRDRADLVVQLHRRPSKGIAVPSSAPPTVDDAVLADLRSRLRHFRPVATAGEHGWDRGVDPLYLAELVDYWANTYDWRNHEQRIAAMPWVTLSDGPTPIRAIHQPAGHDATAVVLLHGWPDSVLRFERILPLLTDLNVVVPALPGFPFAARVPGKGLSSTAMAEAVAQAVAELGYTRYVVSAGDVGCDVAEALAAAHPESVSALHLTDVSQYHFLAEPPTDLSPREQEYARYGHHWQATEGGYMHEQSTKPQTIAVGLGDSPAGLAAWILEKLRTWTDSDGNVESAFTRDQILTWITAYWVTGTIGTSFTPYAESGSKPWSRIQTPTAFTVFARDLVNAPREFADRFFNVQDWQELSAGGHFAAWERPQDYVRGIRTAASLAAAH